MVLQYLDHLVMMAILIQEMIYGIRRAHVRVFRMTVMVSLVVQQFQVNHVMTVMPLQEMILGLLVATVLDYLLIALECQVAQVFRDHSVMMATRTPVLIDTGMIARALAKLTTVRAYPEVPQLKAHLVMTVMQPQEPIRWMLHVIV